ncbi:hypothetical protein L6452_02591 [Arctium lappa]|uniref:Uncharacterized protein n=1 Tax=Arctium lappa TaxID=4217 RepID=A0ACB9FK06_ARCLA|nr:hypothetical protein L6452_02591 [Arctium lappa]
MDDTYSMNEIYVKDVVGSSSGFQAEEDSNVDGLTGASSDSNISGRKCGELARHDSRVPPPSDIHLSSLRRSSAAHPSSLRRSYGVHPRRRSSLCRSSGLPPCLCYLLRESRSKEKKE